MTWKDQAPLVYVVISVVAAISFAASLVVAIRRQPHRFERIRRFLCCMTGPLQGYTSVEEEDPFVIGGDDDDDDVIGGDNDDDEQEIELPITPKSEKDASTVHMTAETV